MGVRFGSIRSAGRTGRYTYLEVASMTQMRATKRMFNGPVSVPASGAGAISGIGAGNGNGAGSRNLRGKPSGNVYKPECPARKALETIASKWAILVMHSLLDGPMRFNALQRRLEGVSQKVLTQQLRKLEGTGIISRTVRPTVPPSVEYALTEPGRELKDALSGLCAWANKHAALLGVEAGAPTCE